MQTPSAKATCEYQPTIIESRLLIRRLASQLTFLKNELNRSWIDFKNDPLPFIAFIFANSFGRAQKFLSTPERGTRMFDRSRDHRLSRNACSPYRQERATRSDG